MDGNTLSPSLTGIVLAGGQSRRMGTDKSMLEIDGVPMYLFAARLLQKCIPEVFISVNKYQVQHNNYAFPALIDRFESEGPMGALVSCHQQCKGSLLLLACDMPAVTEAMIKYLLSLHNPESLTTMFCNAENFLYEPMFSVWEVPALVDITGYFLSGGRSFQQYLSSRSIPQHLPPNMASLANCNTPGDWKMWEQDEG
jgi:molybdopterin-guanine dinucleotide biosynthesis protein A